MVSSLNEHSSRNEFAHLVRRVMAGDDFAMTQLTELYGPAMRRTARELIGRTLQSHLDSVDLVQSVQLILWLGLRTGKFELTTPESLLGLARTLLRRKVARYCRDVKPQMSQTIEGRFDQTIDDEKLIQATGETEPTRNPDLVDFVEHFTKQLGDLDRRVVSLRLEGHSTAEVARRLNVDSGSLRVRLGRLRIRFANFREQLATSTVRITTDASRS